MAKGLCLVTGGAGFIGSHLVDGLLAAGYPVRVLDDLSTGDEANLAHLRGTLKILRGDLRDSDAVRAAMSGVEVVFHLAAISSVQRSIVDPVEAIDVNVRGAMQVLQVAQESGVRRVVIASSAAVYGDSEALPLKESAAPNPLSPYAVHKLACEHLCKVFSRMYGLETVALRYFNVYGARQRPDAEYAAAIPRFVERLRRNQAPVIFGDGEQTRDFIHISDVVRANLLAAQSEAAVGQVMNIASGQGASVNEVVRTLTDLTGATVEPRLEPAQAGDIRESVADITLARDLLGFEPQVSLREGLAALIEQLRGTPVSASGAYARPE
ncbi:MAG TPA: SDR family oxidoreductase [Ktedonobacterales bacterium]|nr:SDR family oxidoreductase [Ktedonobacterales bacterium]